MSEHGYGWLYCEHANECPLACPCPARCICRKEGYCRNQTAPPDSEPEQPKALPTVFERLVEDD